MTSGDTSSTWDNTTNENGGETVTQKFISIDNSITSINNTIGGLSLGAHTHPISDVINLQAELNNRSLVGHQHIMNDVTGLQAALNGKAALSHTHVIGDIANLQITLGYHHLVH